MHKLYKTYIWGQNMHLIIRYAFICIMKVRQMSPYYMIRFPPNFRTDIQNRRNKHYMQN